MQIRGKVTVHDGTGSHGRALNTVVHGGKREFRSQGGRGQGRSRRRNSGKAVNENNSSSNGNNSNGGFNSNGNSHGGNGAGNAQGARGRGRGIQASGQGRGRRQDNGQNHEVRCTYCHDSTEHGWHNCPLRLSHEAEDAKEQANAVQECTSHACFMQAQEGSSELEGFKLVVGDSTQVEKAPAAAQPEECAAGDVQVQEAPGVATQDEPGAVHVQVEDAPVATQHVAFTNAFHVEKVNPLPVGSTTVLSGVEPHGERRFSHLPTCSRDVRLQHAHKTIVRHVERYEERYA